MALGMVLLQGHYEMAVSYQRGTPVAVYRGAGNGNETFGVGSFGTAAVERMA